MSGLRFGVEVKADVSDVRFEGDIAEMVDLVEDALAPWKPTVTFEVRTYISDGEEKS